VGFPSANSIFQVKFQPLKPDPIAKLLPKAFYVPDAYSISSETIQYPPHDKGKLHHFPHFSMGVCFLALKQYRSVFKT